MASEQAGVVLRSIQTLFAEGTTGGLTDGELLDRFLVRGDEAAFEALVVRHGPMVLDVCRRLLTDGHDAEDAFQVTFLILARNARRIRKPESLASWLFGVARRVALRARLDAARRRIHERARAELTMSMAHDSRDQTDISALHEEIGRMPAKYRDPVILCYLEGMTYEAAAHQLRCPVGTLSIRLLRARERLRGRLLRRGVAVPSALIAASAASSAVSAPLVQSTVRAASAFAAGKATAGLVSASVALLMENVMSTMRWKSAGAGLLALGLFVAASAAGLGMIANADDPEKVENSAKPAADPPWTKTLQNGVVVELIGVSSHPSGPKTWWDPEGRPLAIAPYSKTSVRMNPARDHLEREFAIRVRIDDEHVEAMFQAEPETGILVSKLKDAKDKFKAARRLEKANGPSVRFMEERIRSLTEQIEALRKRRFPFIRDELLFGDVSIGIQPEKETVPESQVLAGFRVEPHVIELYRELAHAETRYNNARRKTRNAADPSLVFLQRQKQRLEQEISDLWEARKTGPRKALAAQDALTAPRPRWQIVPASGLVSGHPQDSEGRAVPDLMMVAASIPRDRPTCTVRFGLSVGSWTTEAACDTSGGSLVGNEAFDVIFSRAQEIQGGTTLTVSHTGLNDPVRILAIGLDGREHRSARTQTMGARAIQQQEVQFDIPPSKIKEFRFQTRTRSFEWAAFPGVALTPRGEGVVPPE